MKKQLCALGLSLCMALSLLPTTALAVKYQVERTPLSGGTKLAANEDYHSYVNYSLLNPTPRNFSDVIRSHLTPLADGTLMVTSYRTAGLLAQQFDKRGKFLSEKTIPNELPLYGGFYAGKEHYFLLFGQENKAEDNTRETFRLVKYSKDWVRLGQASSSNNHTILPFNAGSVSMAELDGKLYIHTNHEMYAAADGINHQANITFTVDLASMAVIDNCSQHETKYSGGYSGHSFNQYIATGADGTLYTADHGGAYPRSMRVVKRDPADLTVGEGQSNFLPFAGKVGEVFTGAQLGGLAVGSTVVLTVGTIINQDRSDIGLHNVYLSATSRNAADPATTVTMLTDYKSKVTAGGNPHLVALGGDRFMMLWNEKPSTSSEQLTYALSKSDKANTVLCYAIVDGTGKQIGEIERTNAILSDCPPVLTTDGKVMWYASDGSKTTLYALASDAFTPIVGGEACPNPGPNPDTDTSPCILPGLGAIAATPSPTKLMVNGTAVSVDAYLIDQNNYIKLRDLAYIINGTAKNFDVKWDDAKKAINLTSNTPYTVIDGDMVKGNGQATTATVTTSKIYVDGVEKPLTAYFIGQSNYFRLRDVMQVFNVGVGYDGATNTATLDTAKSY